MKYFSLKKVNEGKQGFGNKTWGKTRFLIDHYFLSTV